MSFKGGKFGSVKSGQFHKKSHASKGHASKSHSSKRHSGHSSKGHSSKGHSSKGHSSKSHSSNGHSSKSHSTGQTWSAGEVSAVKFAELAAQFKRSFKGTPPTVSKIYDVTRKKLADKHFDYATKIGNVQVHGSGKNPGNQQKRFHQTDTLCKFAGTPCSHTKCATCSIIKTGFDMKYASSSSRFGKGLYSSATSSKAYTYGNKKAMFVVGVAAGKVQVNGNSGALDAGYHSRVADSTVAQKAGENNDELIVFQNEAMLPKYLIVFS